MTSNQSVSSDSGNISVDLTNCDREKIHQLGRVQSFGALISVSPNWIVNHVSENIAEFVGITADALLGRPLTECFTNEAVHAIRTKLQMLYSEDAVERQLGMRLLEGDELFDIAVHRSGRSTVIELEKHGKASQENYFSYVRQMIDRLEKSATVKDLCSAAARYMAALTGFDRVMVYKFEADDSGVVIAESLRPGMESFEGLRYPASDIPKQARALYTRNLLRIIADVSDEGRAVQPPVSPEGEPLDLSLSLTRAVSPVHLEYLRNMGVAASLSVSILKRGKLWGLFACHNETPTTLPLGTRTAAELFGQMFAFLLDRKESDTDREDAARARVLHDQLMAQLAEDSDIAREFDTIIEAIQDVIDFDGAVGWIGGEYVARGETPTQEEFHGLLRFLNTTASSEVFSHEKLVAIHPDAAEFADRAAGLLVLPVSRTPRDFIVLFRREIAKTVRWAGNPDKPVETGPLGARLTPRKSFEVWKQTVKHECAPWSESEINAADALRITLLEVILRMSDASSREQTRSQEKQELLIAELNHRVRNILNLVRSLIAQTNTGGRDIAQFTEVIGGRIHALARAHDQITHQNWAPASFYELVDTETEAYLVGAGQRVAISGTDAMLKPGAFTTLSLVVHELVTNSVKYGALSKPAGKVEIRVEALTDAALRIVWRETGGPPIQSPPVRKGFGTTIIERSIPYELKGEASVRYDVTGLEAEFMVPPPFIEGFRAPAEKAKAVGGPDVSRKKIFTGEVLVVEDNLIIAMDAEQIMRDLGAAKVQIANSVTKALDILDTDDISFALLDVNLGSETSEPVAQALQSRGIRFAFATGYGDRLALTKAFPDAAIIVKPYDAATVVAGLSKDD